MSDEEITPQEGVELDADASAGPESGELWRDVVTQLDALSEAIGAWTKAAVTDPKNRERVQELKDRVSALMGQAGEAAGNAADSDIGQNLKEAADKAGDALKGAGERFSEEVAPRMADAFQNAAEKLREATDKIEDRAEGGAEADEESAEATEADGA
jgi:uncharacterized protein YukE